MAIRNINGLQNITISDDGLETITITGPDLSPFATKEKLNAVSGTLQTQIDGIDIHSRYTDVEAVSATEAERVVLSDALQTQIDGIDNHSRYTDSEAVSATEASRTSLSGSLQTQIDGITPGVWEVLGSVELTSDATFLEVNNLSPRDYLKVLIDVEHEKSLIKFVSFRFALRFNGDSGSNYADTKTAPFPGQTALSLIEWNGSWFMNPGGIKSVLDIENRETKNKSLTSLNTIFEPGNKTFDIRNVSGTWNNSSNSINTIRLLARNFDETVITNSSFKSGSRILVLGMNF